MLEVCECITININNLKGYALTGEHPKCLLVILLKMIFIITSSEPAATLNTINGTGSMDFKQQF